MFRQGVGAHTTQRERIASRSDGTERLAANSGGVARARSASLGHSSGPLASATRSGGATYQSFPLYFARAMMLSMLYVLPSFDLLMGRRSFDLLVAACRFAFCSSDSSGAGTATRSLQCTALMSASRAIRNSSLPSAGRTVALVRSAFCWARTSGAVSGSLANVPTQNRYRGPTSALALEGRG